MPGITRPAVTLCPEKLANVRRSAVNVEDVAEDIAAQKGIGAAHGLHLRFTTGGIQWGRHKRIFVMAARQVFQTTADYDAAASQRLVGIREVHFLFRQERAQMFIDLLQWRVFEGCTGAVLRFALFDFV
jgi:hypothetical protein